MSGRVEQILNINATVTGAVTPLDIPAGCNGADEIEFFYAADVGSGQWTITLYYIAGDDGAIETKVAEILITGDGAGIITKIAPFDTAKAVPHPTHYKITESSAGTLVQLIVLGFYGS